MRTLFKRGSTFLALTMLLAGVVLPTSAMAQGSRPWTRSVDGVGIAAVEADDSIATAPWLDGVEIDGTQTINGTAGGADLDDVFAVWLSAGEQLTVSLTPPGGSDWGLGLYDPYAEDFDSDMMSESVAPAAYGGPGASPITLSFYAADSGPHYIDVYALSGSGAYELTVTITRLDTDVRISSSTKTLPLYSYPTITGSVIDRLGRAARGDVYLYYSYDLLNWIPVSGTNTTGSFTLYGNYQDRKTYYLVTFEGNASYCTNSQGVGAYATSVILKNPVAPTTMKAGTKTTVYAKLEPLHTSGTYPVRIYKWKKVSGSWKAYGYVKAKAAKYNDYTSKCSVSMSLPSTGSWRLRAYAPADSKHAATWSSGYDYVTVK